MTTRRDAATSIDQVKWTETPQSSWVARFRYFVEKLQLQVQFKDGFIAQYRVAPNIGANIRKAGSKGKFVHRVLWNLPYMAVGSSNRYKRGRTRRKR